jgi:hypothetical protein
VLLVVALVFLKVFVPLANKTIIWIKTLKYVNNCLATQKVTMFITAIVEAGKLENVLDNVLTVD